MQPSEQQRHDVGPSGNKVAVVLDVHGQCCNTLMLQLALPVYVIRADYPLVQRADGDQLIDPWRKIIPSTSQQTVMFIFSPRFHVWYL
jgi:hypothetical protein